VFASVTCEGAPASGGPPILIRGLTPAIELARDPRTGTVHFGRNDRYTIHAVNAAGEDLKSFGLEKERIAIDDAGKKAHFAGRPIPEERLADLVESLPSELTHFRRLQVIDDLLYVTATTTIDRAPRGVSHDIFTLEGKYLYRGLIEVPGSASISGSEDNLVLGDGYFVAVLSYPGGAKSVACYEVKMPSSE
jgi:hypothetical protein